MKRIIAAFCFVATMSVAGIASAIPYTWTDTINLGDPGVLLDSWNERVTLVHNITDGPVAFNRGWDTVSDYQLIIDLSNFDKSMKSTAAINLPGSSTDTYFNFSLDDAVIGASIEGIAMLNATGHLSLTIINARGAFYVEESELIANGNDIPGAVPEPATFVLLGGGLLGLGIFGRRKMKK